MSMSSLVVNPHSAYEGEPCEVQAHCVENSVCSPEKRCQCSAGFPAKNGLCCRFINSEIFLTAGHRCTLALLQLRTSTPFAPAIKNACRAIARANDAAVHPAPNRLVIRLAAVRDDARIALRGKSLVFDLVGPKVVKIYTSWAEANSNNAFCVSSASCIDSVAECVAEPAHPTQKFCKCPYGYQVKDNNERCGKWHCQRFAPIVSDAYAIEPNRITLLSPLSTVQSSYQECGVCEDSHAACMTAASEKTCWCRSSYQKRDTRCGKVNCCFMAG